MSRAYRYSGLRFHRDENMESGTKRVFTRWKPVETPSVNSYFEYFVVCVISGQYRAD